MPDDRNRRRGPLPLPRQAPWTITALCATFATGACSDGTTPRARGSTVDSGRDAGSGDAGFDARLGDADAGPDDVSEGGTLDSNASDAGPCEGATCCATPCPICSTCTPSGACELSQDPTACGPGMSCDGKGHCLVADGGPCSAGGDCASGQCISGMCGIGITGCSQLAVSGSRAVVANALLERTWPTGNPAGQAVLVGGDFANISALCLDGQPLDPSYRDISNAMVVIPEATPQGPHELVALTAAGAVSRALSVNVVAEVTADLTYDGAGQKPLFGYDATPFVPLAVNTIPPLTNQWHDEGANAVLHASCLFNLNGTTSSFSVTARPAVGCPSFGLDGAPVAGKARYNVTVTANPVGDAGPARTVAYAGIFVCPQSWIVADDGGTGDGGALGCHTMVSATGTGLARLLMFPDLPSGHQVRLAK